MPIYSNSSITRLVWDALPEPSDPAPPRINYVELKTSAEMSAHDKGAASRFERKLLKFWIQSFLLGVPRIVVGFRTDDMQGRLLRLQEFATTAIPKMVREQGNKSWDSAVCINFAADFLQCTFWRSSIQSEFKLTKTCSPQRNNY